MVRLKSHLEAVLSWKRHLEQSLPDTKAQVRKCGLKSEAESCWKKMTKTTTLITHIFQFLLDIIIICSNKLAHFNAFNPELLTHAEPEASAASCTVTWSEPASNDEFRARKSRQTFNGDWAPSLESQPPWGFQQRRWKVDRSGCCRGTLDSQTSIKNGG